MRGPRLHVRDIDSWRRGADDRATGDGVTFTDVTHEAGLEFHPLNGASAQKHIVETMGSGALFFDFDDDGWLDVFLVDGGSVADATVAARARHRLYRNRGNGRFEDVTRASGVEHRGYAMGACAADYDNDGHVDLYVTNLGPDQLSTTMVMAHSPMSPGERVWDRSCSEPVVRSPTSTTMATSICSWRTTSIPTAARSAAMLARVRTAGPTCTSGVPSAMYRNSGDGTFTDVTKASGLDRTDGKALGVVFADYDNDGRVDLFVANDLTRNFLYHNEGKGTFKEVGAACGRCAGERWKRGPEWEPISATTTATGSSISSSRTSRPRRTACSATWAGLFADATFRSGVGPVTLPFLGFGVAFFDYDNDADLDLAIANGHVSTTRVSSDRRHATRSAISCFATMAKGRFAEVGRQSGPAWALEKVSRALATGDIDNDGDLDLLVSNNGQPPDLLRNDGGAAFWHALLITAAGRAEQPGRHRGHGHGHGRVAAACARGACRVQLPRAE